MAAVADLSRPLRAAAGTARLTRVAGPKVWPSCALGALFVGAFLAHLGIASAQRREQGPLPREAPGLDLWLHLRSPAQGRRVSVGAPPAPFALVSRAAASADPAGAPTASHRGGAPAWMIGLTLPDIPVHLDPRVVHYLEYFRNDPVGRQTMRAWLLEDERYGPWVRRILSQGGLPEDLSAVAMIESGFNPLARSPANALGMWQFVAPTAAAYGLTMNRWVDERRDPEASTKAGGRYLAELFARFGTWELALSAYNMGTANLLRSIRVANSNDYWVLSRIESGLPYETTFYVAKAMACAIIARNRRAFGFDDAPAEALAFEEVPVPGGTPLAAIVTAAGSSEEIIRALNPSLLRERLPPDGPFRLRVPHGTANAVRARFLSPSARATSRTHTVRFGETLRAIAERFGTSESALSQMNDSLREPLAAGEVLMLPDPSARRRSATTKPLAPLRSNVPLNGRREHFFVTTGQETVQSIANALAVSVDELAQWNLIDPRGTLPEGVVLRVLTQTTAAASRALLRTATDVRPVAATSEAFFDLREHERGRVRFRYAIEDQDTLDAIAERFGLSVGSLCRINRLLPSATLEAGKPLIIYAERDRVSEADRNAFDRRIRLLESRWNR